MKDKIKIQQLLSNYSDNRIYWHLIFWTTYLIFSSIGYYTTTLLQISFGKVILHYLTSIQIDIVATYFTVYYLISNYLIKRKYIYFVLLFIISSLFFVICQRFIVHYITYPYFFPESIFFGEWFKLRYFFTVTNIYPVTALFISIKYIKNAFITQKINQELEQKRLEAELKFLKSQIHPHFLFNTLNNLYALTLDKSDQAPEVVLKLSKLLDYILYEANESKMALEKEIDLIQNYIQLEKIRYKNANIELKIDGEIGLKKIAPLILLPFVENSFKHGLSKNMGDLWVHITIRCTDHFLVFKVQNSKNSNQKDLKEGFTEGIGLNNVKRRLSLIYPGKHELKIEDLSNIFNVDLKIIF